MAAEWGIFCQRIAKRDGVGNPKSNRGDPRRRMSCLVRRFGCRECLHRIGDYALKLKLGNCELPNRNPEMIRILNACQ